MMKLQLTEPLIFSAIFSALLCGAVLLIPIRAESQEARGWPGASVKSHDKSVASDGFTLFPLKKSEVHLINMSGKIVQTWPIEVVRARLLKNCNLLVVHQSTGLSRTVTEYDWKSQPIWNYRAPFIAHHDIQRLDNGNTLFLYKKTLSFELPEGQGSRKLRSDVILEVDKEGKTIWEWHADKHLDPYSCGAHECRRPLEDLYWKTHTRDWTHLNTVQVLPENKWYDQGDERFRPGNIVTIPRNFWEILIIDRRTKKVVWRYSGDYKGGLRFPHEAHMIPKGYPGAGNILVFDNGRKKRGSFALEINPQSMGTEWAYENGMDFFSLAHGSLQRLQNGNTILSEDGKSRVLEVSPSKEIVWEFAGVGPLRRAQRYGQRYCEKLGELPLY